MATLLNQGTLTYTPSGGERTSVASNVTSTDVPVTYGLEVFHSVAPATFRVGDTLFYTVLLRNTGTGTLYLPTVTVTEEGGELSYVAGSATAFLFDGTDVVPVAITVTEPQSISVSFDTVIPAGGILYLNYQSVVESATENTIVTTAIGGALAGSETGPTVTDSDTATVTRVAISLTKEAPDTAEVGDSIAYRFIITNDSALPVALNTLTDQLPEGFSFTGVTLTVNGVNVPLSEGTDYTVTEDGLFTVQSGAGLPLSAGAVAVLTLTGVVTA